MGTRPWRSSFPRKKPPWDEDGAQHEVELGRRWFLLLMHLFKKKKKKDPSHVSQQKCSYLVKDTSYQGSLQGEGFLFGSETELASGSAPPREAQARPGSLIPAEAGSLQAWGSAPPTGRLSPSGHPWGEEG